MLVEELRRLYGQNVERGRKLLGVSQAELAKECRVTQQTISHIERGEVTPRDNLKVRLATALHQDVRQLFPLTRVVA